MPQESKTRSLLKSATWRVIGIISGAAVVYIYTDNIGMSAAIAIWCNVIGFILYYVHERMWGKIKWGIEETRHSNSITIGDIGNEIYD